MLSSEQLWTYTILAHLRMLTNVYLISQLSSQYTYTLRKIIYVSGAVVFRSHWHAFTRTIHVPLVYSLALKTTQFWGEKIYENCTKLAIVLLDDYDTLYFSLLFIHVQLNLDQVVVLCNKIQRVCQIWHLLYITHESRLMFTFRIWIISNMIYIIYTIMRLNPLHICN